MTKDELHQARFGSGLPLAIARDNNQNEKQNSNQDEKRND